jgi:hypothetical protein
MPELPYEPANNRRKYCRPKLNALYYPRVRAFTWAAIDARVSADGVIRANFMCFFNILDEHPRDTPRSCFILCGDGGRLTSLLRELRRRICGANASIVGACRISMHPFWDIDRSGLLPDSQDLALFSPR